MAHVTYIHGNSPFNFPVYPLPTDGSVDTTYWLRLTKNELVYLAWSVKEFTVSDASFSGVGSDDGYGNDTNGWGTGISDQSFSGLTASNAGPGYYDVAYGVDYGRPQSIPNERYLVCRQQLWSGGVDTRWLSYEPGGSGYYFFFYWGPLQRGVGVGWYFNSAWNSWMPKYIWTVYYDKADDVYWVYPPSVSFGAWSIWLIGDGGEAYLNGLWQIDSSIDPSVLDSRGIIGYLTLNLFDLPPFQIPIAGTGPIGWAESNDGAVANATVTDSDYFAYSDNPNGF